MLADVARSPAVSASRAPILRVHVHKGRGLVIIVTWGAHMCHVSVARQGPKAAATASAYILGAHVVTRTGRRRAQGLYWAGYGGVRDA